MDRTIEEIKIKFPYIDNITHYEIINNIIVISCYIKHNSNSFILYPNGKIKYNFYENWEYIASFNQERVGNGIIFIELKTFNIIKSFYYIDDVGMDWGVLIYHIDPRFIITEHEERSHIIFIDDFSVLSFCGTNYKIYESYILFFPYFGYSTCDTFSLVDINSKRRADLNYIIDDNILKNDNGYNGYLEFNFTIDKDNNSLLYKGNYSLDIKEIFKQKKSLARLVKNSYKNTYNIQKLEDIYHGYALDIHTTKSTLMEDGSFDTIRTEIGELIYQIKYKYNKELIPKLSNIIAIKIREIFGINIDVIIPIPPSNLNRPYQPVLEITKEISDILSIPYDLNYLQKKPTIAIKSIDNYEERIRILKDAFLIRDTNYKNKTILLFDDLYRSGSTIKSACNVLQEIGKIHSILVLTITKTRTKK